MASARNQEISYEILFDEHGAIELVKKEPNSKTEKQCVANLKETEPEIEEESIDSIETEPEIEEQCMNPEENGPKTKEQCIDLIETEPELAKRCIHPIETEPELKKQCINPIETEPELKKRCINPMETEPELKKRCINPMETEPELHKQCINPIETEPELKKRCMNPIETEPELEKQCINPIETKPELEKQCINPTETEPELEKQCINPKIEDLVTTIKEEPVSEESCDGNIYDANERSPQPEKTRLILKLIDKDPISVIHNLKSPDSIKKEPKEEVDMDIAETPSPAFHFVDCGGPEQTNGHDATTSIDAGSSTFECSSCEIQFTSEHSYMLHMKHHYNAPQLHTCFLCGIELTARKKLFKHLKEQHPEHELYTCTRCPMWYTDREEHRVHQQSHGLMQCRLCEERFGCLKDLDMHVNEAHVLQRPYACKLCIKRYITRSELSRHEKTHSEERPFACLLCPGRFRTRGGLTDHERNHTTEKYLHCPHCPSAFKKKTALKMHIKRHEETALTQEEMEAVARVKPYSCAICGARFVASASLRRHLRNNSCYKSKPKIPVPKRNS